MLLNEIKEVRNKIQLIDSPIKVKDFNGKEFEIINLEIDAESYIPDIYVRMSNYDYDDYVDENNPDWENNIYIGNEENPPVYESGGLEDDTTFIAGIMNILKSIGYKGKPFGRAELGMQGKDFIVLEPGQEFEDFAKESLGWKDKDDNPANPINIMKTGKKFIEDDMDEEFGKHDDLDISIEDFERIVLDALPGLNHIKSDINTTNDYAVIYFTDKDDNKYEAHYKTDGTNSWKFQLNS